MSPRRLIPGATLPVVLLTLLATPGAAQESTFLERQNGPVEPFRMMGNLHYVGASGVTSFLLTSSEGHVLLDGGFPETAPMILENVEKLGFDIRDVRVLLNSHAHFDHSGGLAALQEASGARVVISRADADVVEAGGKGDPVVERNDFPAVEVDRRIADGETVKVGPIELTAHVTAGHTPGCTTWSFRVREGGKTYDVVSICSLTVLSGMRLTGEPSYPGIREDFERSFRVLRSLPVDVFLASHTYFFDMAEKRERLESGAADDPFVDAGGYRAYIDAAEATFRRRLEEERGNR